MRTERWVWCGCSCCVVGAGGSGKARGTRTDKTARELQGRKRQEPTGSMVEMYLEEDSYLHLPTGALLRILVEPGLVDHLLPGSFGQFFVHIPLQLGKLLHPLEKDASAILDHVVVVLDNEVSK